MQMLLSQRPIVVLIVILLAGAMLKSCSKRVDVEGSPEYQAACYGHPLRTDELRNKAMEDGYTINYQYDCIDKASFVAVNEEKARWEAYNTPEAIAKRRAGFEEQKARDAELRALETNVEDGRSVEDIQDVVLHDVDASSATEADIANVICIGPDVASQIVEERRKRPFNDWADLINRVVGLSAAQSAFEASVCGLNVNGMSLAGAAPDARVAASIYKKYRRY